MDPAVRYVGPRMEGVDEDKKGRQWGGGMKVAQVDRRAGGGRDRVGLKQGEGRGGRTDVVSKKTPEYKNTLTRHIPVQFLQPFLHHLIALLAGNVVADDRRGGVPVVHRRHGAESPVPSRIPDLNFAGYPPRRLYALGNKKSSDGRGGSSAATAAAAATATSGRVPVVSLGEAKDQGGLAGVRRAKHHHLELRLG